MTQSYQPAVPSASTRLGPAGQSLQTRQRNPFLAAHPLAVDHQQPARRGVGLGQERGAPGAWLGCIGQIGGQWDRARRPVQCREDGRLRRGVRQSLLMEAPNRTTDQQLLCAERIAVLHGRRDLSDPDVDGDGRSDLEQSRHLITMWRQGTAGAPWAPVDSATQTGDGAVEAELLSFSRYALAI